MRVLHGVRGGHGELMKKEMVMDTELMTKADLQAAQAALITWIVGTSIAVVVVLQLFIRLM